MTGSVLRYHKRNVTFYQLKSVKSRQRRCADISHVGVRLGIFGQCRFSPVIFVYRHLHCTFLSGRRAVWTARRRARCRCRRIPVTAGGVRCTVCWSSTTGWTRKEKPTSSRSLWIPATSTGRISTPNTFSTRWGTAAVSWPTSTVTPIQSRRCQHFCHNASPWASKMQRQVQYTTTDVPKCKHPECPVEMRHLQIYLRNKQFWIYLVCTEYQQKVSCFHAIQYCSNSTAYINSYKCTSTKWKLI